MGFLLIFFTMFSTSGSDSLRCSFFCSSLMTLRAGPSDLLRLEGLHCWSFRSSDCNQASVSTLNSQKCHQAIYSVNFINIHLVTKQIVYIRASCVQEDIVYLLLILVLNQNCHNYQKAIQKNLLPIILVEILQNN